MAAYMSSQSGNWNDPATWGGAGVPGAGDTARVQHPITVTTDAAIGTSASSNSLDLEVFGAAVGGRTGALTINSGVTFTIMGGVNFTDGTITLQPGATWRFDGSGAATPSAAAYSIAQSSGAKLVCSGTSGSRCAVTQVTAGGAARCYISGGQVDAAYTDFSHLSFIQGSVASGQTFSFQNCTFDDCNDVSLTTALVSDGVYSFVNSVWSNSLGSCLTLPNIAPAANTSGVRLIQGNTLDQQPSLFAPKDFTISGNYFNQGFNGSSTQIGKWASCQNNLIRVTSSAIVHGGAADNYFLYDDPSGFNPHTLAHNRNVGDVTFSGNVFEFTGTDDTGDCILLGDASGDALGTASVVTITGNIVLPNGGTGASGTLFTCWGASDLTVICNHNTYRTGGQAATVGEGYNGFAGMLLSGKSNLAWNPSATVNSGAFRDLAASHVTDIASSSSLDFNWCWNISTAYQSFVFSSGSPGVHDLTGDPQFVDSARNFATWSVAQGYALSGDTTATKIANGLNQIKATPSLVQTSLIPYVRAGFAPQNAMLKNAGHDGTDIGAVALAFNTYNETGSGGTYGASAASVAATYSPLVATGGGYLNGAGVATPVFNPLVAASGVFGNSTGSTNARYTPQPAPFGGYVTGTAYLGASVYDQFGSGGMFVAGAAPLFKLYSYSPTSGCFGNGSGEIVGQYTINDLAGVWASGTIPENTPPSPAPPPRALPYPMITFRVNLDRTATQGTPCDTSDVNRQYLLSLERLFIPGVGEVKHGDVFTLYGIEADYVKRWYAKVGRLPYDPQNTLEVLSIE